MMFTLANWKTLAVAFFKNIDQAISGTSEIAIHGNVMELATNKKNIGPKPQQHTLNNGVQ